jgi:enolase
MKITDINITEIFDSRGEPTIEVSVVDAESRDYSAEIPSGKSRGGNEASVLSFAEAGKILIDVVRPGLIGKEFSRIGELDEYLISLDPSPHKHKIGGNLSLGISIAVARGLAHEQRTGVWEMLNKEFFGEEKFENIPAIYSNFVNGGLHARNNLSIQEYLVIAETRNNISETVRSLIDLYRDIGESLRERSGISHMPIGDEGGYSYDFKNNFEPLQILNERITGEKMDRYFHLGIDAAANSFARDGKYFFDSELITADELLDKYIEYAGGIEIFESIEDPFAESDAGNFANLADKMPRITIVGDDITTTSAELIEKMSKKNAVNGVIIKPNQIGTITETCEAIK